MSIKHLSGYDEAPNMQHNFNDGLRQGTGNAPDMNSGDPEGWDEGQERYEIEFEGNQSFTDKELEESLTFPNTDYTGDHPPSDINTGPEELRKITDFKSSAPSSSFSSLERLVRNKQRLAKLKARRQG